MREKETAPVVFVTGFGPYGRHAVNSSWQSVKLLPSMELEKEFNVRLVVEEIPARYDYVPGYMYKKWRELKPHLVVHCGMSPAALEVIVEQRAYGTGYVKEDIYGCVPEGGKCRQDVDDSTCLVTGFDLGLVSRNVNATSPPCLVVVSNSAGRYLCEFTFFTSLCEDTKRVAFIHVPKLGQYTATEIAKTLKLCIGELLKQLEPMGGDETPSICDNARPTFESVTVHPKPGGEPHVNEADRGALS